MADYVTNVLEITEAGVPMHAEGEHVVRVLGAAPRLVLASASGTKMDMLSDTSALARYLAGDLQPPPAEAGASADPFQVPEAVVLASGEIEFLKRGGVA